jgi:hypothetical protein
MNLFFPFSARAGEVVSLEKYRRHRHCSSLLREGFPREAALLAFGALKPEFRNFKDFQESAQADQDYEYFFTFGPPSFSRRQEGYWSVTPPLSTERNIYVLRAQRLNRLKSLPAPTGSWRIEDLRQHYLLVSYSQFYLHPLFHLLQTTIQSVRALESHWLGMRYESPHLDTSVLMREGPLRYRLTDFLNSWTPVTDYEESLKEFLKDFVQKDVGRAEESREVQVYVESLKEHLSHRYPPEDVGPLIFSLQP